ncbi:MAG: TonB-dependent receptor [Bacteroides sp.]|nr:TonB-dependent receptor [Bacteroides sp.]
MRKNNQACKLWICLLCSFILLPLGTYAQEKGDTIAGKVHEIENVTVTGKRAPVKITTSSPVQLISKEDIKNLGFQNMADAIRRFAGTNVRDYGGIGGLKTVSVRNLGAAHTAVSYDGVAVSNCQAGQIDIGRFSLDNVSSLSLAIGQDENLLQPARLYASAGVLNIETEKPVFEDGKHSLSQIQVRGGSFGYIAPSVRRWQKLGERTSLSADASFTRADGNYPFTLVNGKYVTKEKRNNSDINSWQGEANLFHTFHDDSRLDIKAYYFYSERGLPGSVTLYNPKAEERLWDENVFAQTRYKKQISDKWTLQAQAKFNHSWNKYEDTDVKYENGKQTDINRQDEYYLSATLLYHPAKGLDISLAQDGFINTLHTNINDSPNPVRYSSLTALNARYQWGRVKILGTLVGTFITEEVKAGNTPDDRKRLSPTLSVSIQPWKEEQLYVRAMYKNTFRVPTFNDLYYLHIGNTALRPEKAREYNIGIAWNGKPFAFTDFLSITLDGYYNEVDDKIVAFPSTYVWKMLNYGKVHITGIDATMATSISVTSGISVGLSGNYSCQKAIDLTNPNAKNYKDQLPYTPKHSGNASATIETPWVNLGYSLTGVGERYYMAQNIPVNRIDGYIEHSATLWREFQWSKNSFRLQAEVINFTDKQYDVIKYYPMPGRSFRATGTLRF